MVWVPAAAQDRPDVWYRMRPADPLPCAVQADPVPADQAHRAVLGRAGAGQRGRDRGRTGIQRRATRGRGLISDGLAWVDCRRVPLRWVMRGPTGLQGFACG